MPYSDGARQTRSVSTVILAIVVLTIAGVLAVLGVLIFGGRSASAERSAAIIAGVFAFITPTIAALLAFLRATDASTTATTAAQAGIVAAEKADVAASKADVIAEAVEAKVTEIQDHLKTVNGTMNDRLDSLEQSRHSNEQR